MHRFQWQRLFPLALIPLVAACGSTRRPQAVVVTPSPSAAISAPEPAPAPPAPVEDPVVVLIAASDRHFKAGQTELEDGHVEAAKQEFNRAINVLLESPYGGRTEPRIREHFDRLVDRISTYEVRALATGDGFTEKKYETASIDDLLALSATLGTPAAPPALKDAVQTDLESAKHDIPIPLNPRVLAYIELFQGRLHDFIDEGMRRGSKYLPMIQNVFRAEGLPLDLAFVPLVESAFKPNALSRVKAKGVWQFMTGTAKENGLRHDWYIDERSDVEKATVAAAKYLRTLNRIFDGDWHLALASYNGGPGRMQRAIKRVGIDDFWKLSEKPRVLPRETREYVPMILAAIVIARNPAQYGFSFESEEAPAFETVTLPRPVDLRRVAEWTDTTIDQIQALNPELRRWTTPLKDKDYELKVPAGTADVVAAKLTDAPAADLASLKYYTVKRGETLLGIARKLRVSKVDLAEANDIKATARVAPGQKLMVPHEATVLMAARTDRPAPATEARTTVAQSSELTGGAEASNRIKTFYQVRRGDTLSSIARLFQTTVASIKGWNPRLGGNANLIAGQKLTVYRLAN
ncbi:MAG TPA: transglycosylase SLT domain-containing protein [Vicinamibacterales bacterium]|jgi:membrane-bound lytic murein transglycosylase D|nr:transglycosylase SLT domain-containing protein [Vicinamibacterales bacterium]